MNLFSNLLIALIVYGVFVTVGFILVSLWLTWERCEEVTMEQEVIDKVTDLGKAKFGGNIVTMFSYYAPNGELSRDELIVLLTDADVGKWLTRGLYADQILAAIDTEHHGYITLPELQAAIAAHGGN